MAPAVNPFDVRHEAPEYVVIDTRTRRELDRIAYDPGGFSSRRLAYAEAIELCAEMWECELPGQPVAA